MYERTLIQQNSSKCKDQIKEQNEKQHIIDEELLNKQLVNLSTSFLIYRTTKFETTVITPPRKHKFMQTINLGEQRMLRNQRYVEQLADTTCYSNQLRELSTLFSSFGLRKCSKHPVP